MPLGILNREQFEKEVDNISVFTSKESVIGKVVNIEKGRTLGRTEIPEVIRSIVAEDVIENGRSQNIADKFGISKSSVDAYKNGATSCATYNNPDRQLKQVVDNKRNEISNAARGRLSAALEALTDDKIAGSKARDIASIAKDMSGVVKNMEPQVAPHNNTQVIVYRPRMRDEDEFDVITVNE